MGASIRNHLISIIMSPLQGCYQHLITLPFTLTKRH